MSADVATRVARWRAGALDRVDPAAFARLESLLRRASTRQGPLRALLDARIAALADGYAARIECARGGDAACERGPREAGESPIGRLLSVLAQARASVQHTLPCTDAGAGAPRGALDDVRRLSLRARNASQRRQTLAHAPENAGPLNSARLVQRALSTMREASPAYLDAFLQHADTLAWLEALPVETPVPQGTPKASAAPRSRARARKPRD